MENLNSYSLNSDPLISFTHWYKEASLVEQNPDAMTLSTLASSNNRPDSRTVLYKGMNNQCLTFYTNYSSNKGIELEGNNEACLLFYWHVSKRQVRIHGRVRKMDSIESDKYHQSRDRQSQLASYISMQSSPINDKNALLTKLEEASQKFSGIEIPRPVNWGGYLIEPYEFEFFVYGDFRINDRFLFTKTIDGWKTIRLQP